MTLRKRISHNATESKVETTVTPTVTQESSTTDEEMYIPDDEDDDEEMYTPDDIDCMKTYKAFKKLDSKRQQSIMISVMRSLDMKGLTPGAIKTDKIVAFKVACIITEPEYHFWELVKG